LLSGIAIVRQSRIPPATSTYFDDIPGPKLRIRVSRPFRPCLLYSLPPLVEAIMFEICNVLICEL